MDFEIFWRLYEQNFPPEERRTKKDQRKVMEDKRYHLEPITSNEKIAGFIAYWSLGTYTYIEHIAVDDAFKGQGIGSSFIQKFTKKHDNVVLEALPPEDPICKRRINFYKRLGFVVNPYPYMMPRLSENGHELPLVILSHEKRLSQEEFEELRLFLYTIVYGTTLEKMGIF